MINPDVKCSYIELKNVEELKPHPKNYNQHPEEQLVLMAKIIRHQGWRRPVRVSNLSGCIVAGHGAWLVAKCEGWKVPVDYQDYESKAQELEDLVADNKLAELAQVDEKELEKLLSEIEDVELAGILEEFENDDEEEQEPEVIFSEVMDESNNFIVLKFGNDVDWLQALTHFNIESVTTRAMNGKAHSRGVGRVIDGSKYLKEVSK